MQKSNLKTLTAALRHPVIHRALYTTAVLSGGLAVALSGCIHFGLMPPAAPVSVAGTAEKSQRTEDLPSFNREKILDDSEQRISDEFAVPADLRERVAFWFDVYSKYDSNHKVIHDADHPWIVFKIIDVDPIVNSDTPKVKWLRVDKADKLAKAELKRVRSALESIANKKDLKKLSEDEELVLEALKPLGGDLKKQARLAARQVRIQTGQRDFFKDGLRESPRYLGEMERIFAKHKLPVELTRIPFVESSFNASATSKVGAAGVWQLMEGTGRKFLTVNNKIDERISPIKATEAAAKLLKENHMILYRSWPLAVTAWNHGPGGIRKAVTATHSREIGKIVANYRSRSFDFASSNFYSEFLAALHTERYQDQIFGKLDKQEAIDMSVVKLSRKIRPSSVLKVSGISREQLLVLNPELKSLMKADEPLPVGFRLNVPVNARLGLERMLASRDGSAFDRLAL
jgi:membrane-bound lytic murein transglycosylase D